MQRLSQERVDEELAKVEQPRDGVPVWAWSMLDGAEVRGELLGWADDPNGGGDGLRGLVRCVREYAPGFHAEALLWVRADHIRQRRDA